MDGGPVDENRDDERFEHLLVDIPSVLEIRSDLSYGHYPRKEVRVGLWPSLNF